MPGMKPRLILHIGTEKTATTYIQRFLSINRDALARSNIYVPDFLGSPGHRLSEYAFESPFKEDGFSMRKGLYGDLPKKTALKNRVKEAWAANAMTRKEDTWIVSSEHFQSRLDSQYEIASLWEFIGDLYSDVTIVIYLRDPVSVALSSLSTAVKTGSTSYCIDAPGGRFDHASNHRAILELWSSVAPRRALQVRLYDDREFVCSDIIRDFFAVCKLRYHANYLLPARMNNSLSLPALRLMSQINTMIPAFINGAPNPKRKGLLDFVQGLIGPSVPILPSRRLVEKYDRYYNDSIRFLKNNFFSGRHGRLWSYPRVDNAFANGNSSELMNIEEINLATSISKRWAAAEACE